MKRWSLYLLTLGALAWVVYLFSLGGAVRALFAVLAYITAGYVIWRALPAIRADVHAVESKIPARRRSHRGGHL